MRKSEINRVTKETEINLKLNIDGTGISEIDTGCGFLNHMLTLFSKHGKFDIYLKCVGDTYVDYHHTVEDVGICLGNAFKKALDDKKGIYRYGDCITSMDESLILTAVDLSGRSFLEYDVKYNTEKVGDFDTELVEEFWLGFIRNSECALHIKMLSGRNTHHIIECIFKSVSNSLKQAAAIDDKYSEILPSTKGIL